MPFRSIVGHRHVVDLLARAVARDWLPPSLILSGPEGVGKRRVALALAQALNCTGHVAKEPGIGSQDSGATARTADAALIPDSRFPIPAVDACGECAACRWIEKGNYPDVRLVQIEEGASIKMDQAREVISLAGYRPYEGRRRVVIIDPADAMEKEAQNALLKTLEETPPASVFVLVTARPDALLPTIRSRCPQIRFGPLTVAELAEVLRRERGLGEHQARAAAIVAGGSVARAIEAASEETTDARSQALALLQEAAGARDPRHLLEQMKTVLGLDRRQGGTTVAEDREQVTLSLRALTSLLRDVLMIGAGGPASDLANADLREDLERVSASLGRAHVMSAFAAVDRALAALGGNVNPKLVVDWLAFQM